jgi:hypothetical protein
VYWIPLHYLHTCPRICSIIYSYIGRASVQYGHVVTNSKYQSISGIAVDTSLEAHEKSRGSTSMKYEDLERFILEDVTVILEGVAAKSDRLVGNLTTNLPETWMHIRTKFDGGKLYNICSRGSWHGRCYGGALRMNPALSGHHTYGRW